MSLSPPPLIDRLMAPATRLMSRLTFPRKAMVIGASFMLTCGVLGGVIAVDTAHSMSATALAGSAAEPLESMHDAMIAMQRHRGLQTRKASGIQIEQAVVAEEVAKIERDLAAVQAWQKEHLDDEVAKPLATVQAAWKKAAAPHDDVHAMLEAHQEALRQMRLLVKEIGQHTGLDLVSDPGLFYIGRTVTDWLPLLSDYSSRQSATATRVIGEGSIWADDRAAFASATTMENYLLDRVSVDMVALADHSPELASKINASMQVALKALERQRDVVQTRILDAETIDLPIEAMATEADAVRTSVRKAITEVNAALAMAAQAEVARVRNRALLLALACVLALLLSGYLFIGFSRSTSASLDTIRNASQMLAAGQLPERVEVNSRDELRTIGDAVQGAVATLQRFSQAQRAMFEAHQAGNIDERLHTEQFPGAFGVMADETNTLVASHIDTQMRLIGIVGAYARGNLSADIERYPGKKAEITAAVDAVKAGMQAVNAEIKTLVDAGMAGDFSRRGDAQRFEFVYRDMLVSLNSLMDSAERGLGEVGGLLAAVAEGDLGRRVEIELPGQFGLLADNANRTVEQLTQVVGEIRQSSDSINAAASEIAAGNNDLSQRTEQQAAALEETASSMEELTSTVRQNAENARQANQLAVGAAGIAAQGGEVVGRVVTTMSEINHSSKKVAEIISVIDGIAFQTNILALNAAVEAARAGEQGRGFAVVAAEVRSLAQRSANAAKEIKQLIADSTAKVEEGGALVDQAGRTMAEIVGSVKRVGEIIADISTASAEQSAGIEQVNQAITHMDEGTQQNAALVEEASASARALEQQAEQLVQTVAVFRVAQAPSAAPARAAAPRRTVTAPVKPAAPARGHRPARAAAPAAVKAPASGNDSDWQEF